MVYRIIRFPLVLALVIVLVLYTFTGLSSHAQTLIVGEYFNHRAFEYDLNGYSISNDPFASDPTASRFGGMAFDKNGYLYVATQQTNSVSIFAPNGTRIGSIIIPGANNTVDVTFDALGNLYVTGYRDGHVYRLSPSGGITTFAYVPRAAGLAFDRTSSNFTLYVSSADDVPSAGANSIYRSHLQEAQFPLL